MADFRLGRLKFNWRGDWTVATAYVIDDIVKFGANTYVCTTNHTSVTSEADWYSTDLASWSLHTEGLFNRGDWAASQFYRLNDIVKYGNDQYRVTTAHSSSGSFTSANFVSYIQGLKFEDSWDNGTEYQQGDIVVYGGYTYVSKTTNTAIAPNTSIDVNWEILTTGFKVVGNWDSGTAYKPGDVVLLGGNSYVAKITNTNSLPSSTNNNWDFVVGGFTWRGTWDQSTDYNPGDAVARNSNSYICVSASNNNPPETDNTGTYWNSLAQGAQSNVLTTGGDILYVGGAGSSRLPIGDTGNVLTVDGGYPTWKKNSVTQKVYYVTPDGSDTNNGENITQAFATVRHACDNITGPATLYVKAGTYLETLPIIVPEYVSIVGDNMRTTMIKPDTGNASSTQKVTLAQVPAPSARVRGEIVTNGTQGAHTFVNASAGCIAITGAGTLDVSDAAYDPDTGVLTLTSVGHGLSASDTVTIAAGSLTFTCARDGHGSTHAYPRATDPAHNTALAVSLSGDDQFTVNVGIANKEAMILDDQSGGSVLVLKPTKGGNWTSLDTFDDGVSGIGVSGQVVVNNEHSTMFFMSNKTMMKDLVLDGMDGFSPSGSDPKDLDTATIQGVFLRLNPNSKAIKSPYISQCSCFSNAGVGAIVDGSVHDKFNSDAEPSNKTMLFDSFSQIHNNGGVGFWVTGNSYAEIVSCFTYYAHISYCASNGGQIRSLAGNSSWGTYGIVAAGYNQTETTIDGWIDGLELNYVATTLSTAPASQFDTAEQIVGGTSGAVGEVLSHQPSADKVLYRPLKGTFAQNEVITGQTSGCTATLVNNTDAQKGQDGFTIILGGLTAAPNIGGSIEFVTGPGNAGEDAFTYVISNSSYLPPSGRGELTVNRALLGSTAATHDGLNTVIRYQNAGATSLTSDISTDSATIISVASINNLNTGGYAIIDDEMIQIVSFPTSNSVEVVRGVEGTTAAVHNNGTTITGLAIKVPAETTTLRDLDGTEQIILVLSATGTSANDYIKIDDEFMQVTNSVTLTTGTVTLVLAEEKAADSYDRQATKIRYLYSQVRLTGHDFLDVGTGTKTQTNFPGFPTQDPAPGNEINESAPGRVFYVSTDQDGNFRVGKYFRVNQATGATTLNASSFDLSGLSSLRLGSIGAQIGESISEFSSDVTLSANSNSKCPTQKAVKSYVDTKTKTKGFTFWAGSM